MANTGKMLQTNMQYVKDIVEVSSENVDMRSEYSGREAEFSSI